MMSKDKNVQVCDATKDHSSNTAGYKRIKWEIKNPLPTKSGRD
jgi:hypothetical protein